MKRIWTTVGGLLLAVALTPVLKADVVSDFWTNVFSSGAQPGDKIRVVFITSPVIDGNGVTQAYYDGFGDGQAALGLVTNTLMKGSLNALQPLTAADWQPLVTTVEGGTPVKSWLQSSGVKVFNTAGNFLADSGAAMLSSPLEDAMRYDQSGDNQAPPPQETVGVWTGTNAAGEGAEIVIGGVGIFDLRLGSETPVSGFGPFSAYGDGGDASQWLYTGGTVRSINDLVGGSVPINRSIYVMSGEVTVVPEPSTILLWLGVTGIAGVIGWRKRRRG